MKKSFLLLCSIALLCVSGASAFYIQETIVRNAIRQEKKDRRADEEKAQRKKRQELDEHYARWGKNYRCWYEQAVKKNDSTDESYCLEGLDKLADQMSADGYNRAEIQEIQFKLPLDEKD